MNQTARLALYLTLATFTLAGCATPAIPSQVVETLGVPLEKHFYNEGPGRCERRTSELRCISERLAPANLPPKEYELFYAPDGRLQRAYFASAALAPEDFSSVPPATF